MGHGGIAVETRLLRTHDLRAKMHLFWIVVHRWSHEAAPSSTACSGPCRFPCDEAACQVPGTHHRQSRRTGSRPEGKRPNDSRECSPRHKTKISLSQMLLSITRVIMTRNLPFEQSRQLQRGSWGLWWREW